MINHCGHVSRSALWSVDLTTVTSLGRMSESPPPLAAVCQVTATPYKEANFSACKQLVEEAKERGACMVFLPEGFDYIGSSREETLSLSESLGGETISRYTQLARLKKKFSKEMDCWCHDLFFHELVSKDVSCAIIISVVEPAGNSLIFQK